MIGWPACPSGKGRGRGNMCVVSAWIAGIF